jgi:hypothetical protein
MRREEREEDERKTRVKEAMSEVNEGRGVARRGVEG